MKYLEILKLELLKKKSLEKTYLIFKLKSFFSPMIQ